MIAVKFVELAGHFPQMILLTHQSSEGGIMISISKMMTLRLNKMKLPKVAGSSMAAAARSQAVSLLPVVVFITSNTTRPHNTPAV